MPSTVTAPERFTSTGQRRGHDSRKIILGVLGIIVLAAMFGATDMLWRREWPFEQKSVIAALEEAADSHVQMRGFRRTYFPHPGCILDGVAFTRGSSSTHPLIEIETLTIQGSYFGIFAGRISRIVAEGMHVFIPAFGTAPAFHVNRSAVTVGEFVANGATLEFAPTQQNEQPLRFDIHEALLRDIGQNRALTYEVKVHNPEPPGEVTAHGKFGAWNYDDSGQTPISGEYAFDHADLSVYGGIGGTLSSAGKFSGKLQHIDIAGVTDTPDFIVESGHHPVDLKTEFSADVDATIGDTFLNRVDAHWRKTQVVAHGSIAKSAKGNGHDEKGKTAIIDVTAAKGRIEDILGLFVETSRSPMSGEVTLHAKVTIRPGSQPFLRKISLKGEFGIADGGFTNSSTQESVNKLSAGARGEKDTSDAETALTDLSGQVAIDNGVSTFSDISFGIPGAAARMRGTYNLINYKIDLHGQMKVDTKISKTTTGPKALLLKAMDPLFKKRRKGEVVPIKISGTYDKPSFGLDLTDRQSRTVDLPSHHHVREGMQGSQR